VNVWGVIVRTPSMTMLPAFAVQQFWADVLQYPPATGDRDVDTKTGTLSAYVTSTWISGHFQPELWTHFDNTGPMTTNIAEGWHKSLNSHFGMPHPSIRSFLHWLQKCQFEMETRGIQLQCGRPTRQRLAKYVKLDKDIFDAKVQYKTNYSWLFVAWPVNQQQSPWPAFHSLTENFLDRVAYFVSAWDIRRL